MSFPAKTGSPLDAGESTARAASSVPTSSSLIEVPPTDSPIIRDPEIVRPPLPISAEFDMIRSNYYSNVEIDRSRWMAKLLGTRPDIKEFRERVLPVDRAIEFGRLYLPDDRLLSQNVLLSLISQHLRTLGLVESQSSLHSEWDGPFVIPASFNRSQLTFLVQRGIKHAERFWELTMPGTMPNDPEQKQLLEEISRVIGGAPVIKDDNKPLNSERPEDTDHITVKDGVLKAATLNQLIWICTTDSQYKTPDLVTAVCLTYTSFTKASVLFSKLRERFRIALAEKNPEKMRRSVELTFTFMCTWLKESGREIEASILTAINQFVDSDIKPRFPRLCLKLQEANEGQNVDETIDDTKAPKVELGLKHNLWTGDFTLTSLPPVEFARQLTIWTSKRFMNIKRSEFLDGSWEDIRRQHRSPNIVRINKQMDAFNSWVTYTILNPPAGFERVGIASYFLKVAKKLYKMQNFLNCMWIQTAFLGTPIHRLKKLMAQLDKKDYTWLNDVNSKLLNFDDNMRIPIDISNNALKTKKPVLPALLCFLNTLTKFINAFPATIGDQVNVHRVLEIFTYIENIEMFQKQRYCFLPIDQAQDLFEAMKKIEPEELDQKSKEIEPPQSS